MIPATQSIESLVNKFNALTSGQARPILYERQAWEFLKSFSEADMELVVKYIQRENGKNDYKHSLRLSKLLDDLPRFNDLLSLATEAQTRMKNKTRTPKEQALFESRRADEPQPVKPPVKVSAEFLADSIRNLKQLQ